MVRNKGNSFSVLQDAVVVAYAEKAENRVQSPPNHPRQALVWIDLEMTGLDVETDTILQIAACVTDGNLVHIYKGPEITIHHPEITLETMNEWCIDHHGKSGLTQAVRESQISMAEAEQTILEFIQDKVPEGRIAQLAGNSVYVDLAFLRKYMPRIPDYLSHRLVDVSSIAELCRRWNGKIYSKAPRKKNAHTAMSDILESIEQLQYFKRHMFKDPPKRT